MANRFNANGDSVSPSMVKSVFGQLKSNGYTDGQIIALSHGLTRMAHRGAEHRPRARLHPAASAGPTFQGLTFEYDLSLLGL